MILKEETINDGKEKRQKSGRGRWLFNTTATSVLKDDAKDSFKIAV